MKYLIPILITLLPSLGFAQKGSYVGVYSKLRKPCCVEQIKLNADSTFTVHIIEDWGSTTYTGKWETKKKKILAKGKDNLSKNKVAFVFTSTKKGLVLKKGLKTLTKRSVYAKHVAGDTTKFAGNNEIIIDEKSPDKVSGENSVTTTEFEGQNNSVKIIDNSPSKKKNREKKSRSHVIFEGDNNDVTIIDNTKGKDGKEYGRSRADDTVRVNLDEMKDTVIIPDRVEESGSDLSSTFDYQGKQPVPKQDLIPWPKINEFPIDDGLYNLDDGWILEGKEQIEDAANAFLPDFGMAQALFYCGRIPEGLRALKARAKDVDDDDCKLALYEIYKNGYFGIEADGLKAESYLKAYIDNNEQRIVDLENAQNKDAIPSSEIDQFPLHGGYYVFSEDNFYDTCDDILQEAEIMSGFEHARAYFYCKKTKEGMALLKQQAEEGECVDCYLALHDVYNKGLFGVAVEQAKATECLTLYKKADEEAEIEGNSSRWGK